MIELERLEEEIDERVERLVKNYWNLNKCRLLGTGERPQEEDMNTKTDDATIDDEKVVDVDEGRSYCFFFVLISHGSGSYLMDLYF